MSILEYGFEIYSNTGSLIADVSDLAYNRSISWGRNEAEQISFDMDYDALKRLADTLHTTPSSILSVGSSEIRVRYGTTYIVGGRTDYYKTTLSETDRVVSVTANGFLNMFKDRELLADRTFTATDAAQILWTLINESQSNGTTWNFGVTQGTLETIGNKDRSYLARKNIKEAIVQMTQQTTTPLDISFSYDKKFNVYQRLGSNKPEVVFSYPFNILSAVLPVDGQEIANYITTIGSGFGTEAQAISTDQDSNSQINYKVRQRSYQISSIQSDSELSEHGAANILARKDPLIVPEITVDLNKNFFITSFSVGDSVTVQIDDDSLPTAASGLYRIERIEAKIDEQGATTAKLSLVQ